VVLEAYEPEPTPIHLVHVPRSQMPPRMPLPRSRSAAPQKVARVD
jgi:hypothetical protein